VATDESIKVKIIIMNTLTQQLYDYLETFLPQYSNPDGVDFALNPDDSIYVVFAWDDKLKDTCLEFGIAYYVNDFKTFVEDFKLTSLQQLKQVTRETLWELYNAGKGEVFCSFGLYFDNSSELHFRRRGSKLIAKNGLDESHEVHEILTTPRQFIQYAYAHTPHHL
jgi:hypothetical protein